MSSLSHTNFTNVDWFHLKKSHSLITNLRSKVSKYWKAIKLIVADASFPIFLVFLESLNFTVGKNADDCFFSNERLTLFMFEKMSAKHANLNNHSIAASRSFK